MMEIEHSGQRLRRESAISWSQAMAVLLNVLPTSAAAGMLRHVDVVSFNVEGFDAPMSPQIPAPGPIPVGSSGASTKLSSSCSPSTGSDNEAVRSQFR